MENLDFIIREEPFKMTAFEKAPRASADTAILLYRKAQGMPKGIVIKPEKMVLASTIRMGKYDTKITVDTSARKLPVDLEKVKTEEGYCDFLVNIDVDYRVQDVIEVVGNNGAGKLSEIRREIEKCVDEQQGKFSLFDSEKLKKEISLLLLEIERRYDYFSFQIRCEVQLDENGQKILDSNKNIKAERIIKENTIESEKMNKQMEEDRNRFYYQEEFQTKMEKEKGEQQLNKVRLEQMEEMMQKYGNGALLLKEYGDGKISARELNEILRRQAAEEREFAAQQYWQGVKSGTINDSQMDRFADKFIFSSTAQEVLPGEKQQGIEQQDNYEEVEIEDTEEY